jgi:predicted  nucleic acid-binding Zn-ribbon protein
MNYELQFKELESENERLKKRIDDVERDLADSVRSELDLHDIIRSLNEKVERLRTELSAERK